MKIPSVQTTEGVLLLSVIVIGSYVAYRAYKTGSSIGAGVTETLGNIKDSITGAINTANVAVTSAGARGRAALNGGSAPQDAANQSSAETARLNRQEGAIVDSIPTHSEPSYDAMGNYQGETQVEDVGLGSDTRTVSENQKYSPDAMGLA